VNSLVSDSTKDFNPNDNSIKAIWDRYTKSLNISNVNKKGFFVSAVTTAKGNIADQDTYKSFLKEINALK
jgi:hypothetical protein